MKIVVLAPVHVYDDIRVFRKEAVTLAEAGNDVVLYARTPDGGPLTRQGVDVRPVGYRNRLSRFAMLPRLGHLAWRERADVYHVHNPDTLPIAFALRARRCRVIYDTHEDFRTEILLRGWLPAIVRRPAAIGVSALERLAGRCLDAVIVTQNELLDRIPQATVIGNPPLVDADAAAMALRLREDWLAAEDPSDPLVCAYVGGISEDRGLFRMLELVAELAKNGPARLLLVGPQVNDDSLDRARARPEWDFVDYLGPLPQEEAFAALAHAHVGLILFEDAASHRQVDPNKIYEYMSLGLPFVATDFPKWVDRLGAADAGLFVARADPAASAAGAVGRFARDRAGLAAAGRRAVDYVTHKYSWQADGAPLLLELYSAVMARPGGGTGS